MKDLFPKNRESVSLMAEGSSRQEPLLTDLLFFSGDYNPEHNEDKVWQQCCMVLVVVTCRCFCIGF